jgi:Plasma-membrane choline transporter
VAIVFFILKYWSAAIVFLVFAVFYTLCFLSWWKRIPFAAEILHFTMQVDHRYKSIIATSFLGAFVSVAFAVWWVIAFVTAYMKYHPSSLQYNPACQDPGGNCSAAALILVLLFFGSKTFEWSLIAGFAGFYISEVIKNVIHTTISGIYGAFYVNISCNLDLTA